MEVKKGWRPSAAIVLFWLPLIIMQLNSFQFVHVQFVHVQFTHVQLCSTPVDTRYQIWSKSVDKLPSYSCRYNPIAACAKLHVHSFWEISPKLSMIWRWMLYDKIYLRRCLTPCNNPFGCKIIFSAIFGRSNWKSTLKNRNFEFWDESGALRKFPSSMLCTPGRHIHCRKQIENRLNT